MNSVECRKIHEKDGEQYSEFENNLIKTLIAEMIDTFTFIEDLDNDCCFDLGDGNFAELTEDGYIVFLDMAGTLFQVSVERFKDDYINSK